MCDTQVNIDSTQHAVPTAKQIDLSCEC